MEFKTNKRTILSWTACLIGGTSILFGGIHTCAVLLRDKNYDRDLVFLLASGCILIFCGLLNVIVLSGIKKNIRLANVVSVLSCLFLLAFCLSIIPFFKAKLNYFLIGIHVLYLLQFAAIVLAEKYVQQSKKNKFF